MKRLIFLDALRGFFILYVLLIHAVANVIFKTDTGAINTINPAVVGIMLPFIWIGTWAPFFAFLSGIANVYVSHNLMSKGKDNEALKKIVKGIVSNSVVILLLHYFNQIFFHHSFYYNGTLQYTILTGFVETGVWNFYPEILFYTEAMHIIALSGLFISIILFFLWRNGGFHKRMRNYIILTILGVAILFLSPIFHDIFEPIMYANMEEGNYISALFLKTFIGPRQSTFPNVANAIFGGVLGMMLAEELEFKRIRRYGGIMGFLFIIIDSLILIPIMGFEPADLLLHNIPITVYLLNIGLQILLATFLIGRMEYSPRKQRIKSARRSIWLRRFGLMALTIYMFEGILSEILAKIYVQFWPVYPFPSNIVAILTFILLFISIWSIILKSWEKINFKFSLEWMIVNIVGKLRGRKSSRLQVQSVLYGAVRIPKENVEDSPFFLMPTEELTKTELEFLAYRLKNGISQLKDNFEDGVDNLKELLNTISEDAKKRKIDRKENNELSSTDETPK